MLELIRITLEKALAIMEERNPFQMSSDTGDTD